MSTNRSRFVRATLLLVVVFVVALGVMTASAAPYPTPYLNGFENASDATPFPVTVDADTFFGVTRVASGTGGVVSADGGFHAQVPLSATAGGTLFTRLGGYQSVFPAGGYRASIDIYLDTAVSGIGEDKRMDWSVASNNPAGSHRRDFIFSIGTNGTGGYVMSASNNSPGWPANPGRDPFTITTTGWYTFQHVFRDNAGVLAVDMNVLDSSGTLLKSWTLSDASDIIGTTVGGHRYGWMVVNQFVDLPIDNVRRSGAYEAIFMSTTLPGTTSDLVDFGAEDILKWDGTAWSLWFDGSAAGLTPTGKWKHNLNAIYIPDPAGDDLVVSFTQNARFVPGIVPKVDGMDLVMWDGAVWTLYFDGSDVGLTNKTQEKIDALHILPASPGCLANLLISTQGPGRVTNGGALPGFKFAGEDVLNFCATSLGDVTAGTWSMVLDGSAEGMPRNSTDSISLGADGNTLYLTTKKNFTVDAAAGGHSMVYTFDMTAGTFAGPVFDAPAEGLPKQVDALQVYDLP